MTLVIKAAENITTPKAGALVIPPLAESGVIGYWNAGSFDTAVNGAAVTSWADLSTKGFTLTPNGTVTATVDDSQTSRAVKLVGTGSLWSGSTPVAGIPDNFTIAARLFINENPASVCWALSTIGAGTNGVLAVMSTGTLRAYGIGSTNVVNSSTVSKPGWVTAVASFDYTNLIGKIAVNGGTITSGAISFTSTPASQGRTIRFTGSGLTSGLWVRKAALLDHAASDVEMASLATEMTA